MKWPETLTLVRHDISAYNEFKKNKKDNPLYQRFLKAYEENHLSKATRFFAEKVREELSIKVSDHNTPLAPGAGWQAEEMAKKLSTLIKLPDIIFVSPYRRTKDTFEHMKRGWPDLAKVEIKEEERMREREHGLCLLYNDRKIFYVFHPEQKLLEKLMGGYWYRFPQGENIPDVRARVSRFNDMLVREFVKRNVLVVTHHETILAYRATMERMSANEYIDLDKKDKPINCGVTIYRGNPGLGRDGKLVLDIYNAKLY
ncbi:histidine phosphatase family protein [Candidatus Daviesbacteria bacterium]|nr:histidine phosphatase family protein [Candidatus Daviesbacteria bacterium]